MNNNLREMVNEENNVASGNATQQNQKKYRLRNFNEVIEDAKKLPPAIRLFGDLMYENELTILCGDTNVGKSILLNQIMKGVAYGGQAMNGFINESEAKSAVIIDMELSDRQFSKRLGEVNYSENLYRMDSDPNCSGCTLGFNEVYEVTEQENLKVFGLDNITAFLKDPAKEGDVAINFMDKFNRLKKEKNKTFLVAAHIPKRYETTPFTNNDIAGSKMIANFADSIFFIGTSSKDPNLRYIKHTKGRNSVVSDRVYIIKLTDVNNELKFEFVGMDDEKNHLFSQGIPKESRNLLMKEMHIAGKTMEEIGEEFNINKANVSRALKKLEDK